MFVVGTSWPVLSGDLCGSARLLGAGSTVDRGFGGSDPQVGSSPDPHAQPVLQALAFHTTVTVLGGQGTPQGCTPRLLGCFGGQVLPCATPGPERGLLPSGPRHNLGLDSGCHPGQQVPPELLARGQAQNKPRQSGQARSWGRKYPFPHPGICLPQRPDPLRGAGPQFFSLTKGVFFTQ